MNKLIGTWVEVELVNGKKWIGKIEEWDEEAKNVVATDLREFSVE